MNTPLSDNDRVELAELCSLLVDGALDERGTARLQDLLRSSKEAQVYYVRAMQLSASLGEYSHEMQTPEADHVIRPSQFRRWLPTLAAAAAVVLGLWVGRSLLHQVDAPGAVDDEDSVARLTGGKDCVWEQPAGDEFASGQNLRLKSGFAEVTFDSGAQVVLEGPAQLDVKSAWEAALVRGTLKANVPQEASGFRITHPTVDVVDLGTEFSMTADDASAEVFVIQGAVEVHPKAAAKAEKAVLREKQARRFARAGDSDVRDREQKMQKILHKVAMDRMMKPYHYARWSFDEGSGEMAAADSSGALAKGFPIKNEDRWIQGRWGTAVKFDGTWSTQAELAPPLRRGVRTVAFWTRIPEATPQTGSFLSVPVGRGPGFWLDLTCNRTGADGVLGALRLQHGNAAYPSTTPLRDGRWHHVATVYAPGSAKAPQKSFVKLYIDGRLESFTSAQASRAATSGSEFPDALWLGGNPGSSENFTGLIDELVIADRALTPQEIRYLIRTNTLLATENIVAN